MKTPSVVGFQDCAYFRRTTLEAHGAPPGLELRNIRRFAENPLIAAAQPLGPMIPMAMEATCLMFFSTRRGGFRGLTTVSPARSHFN